MTSTLDEQSKSRWTVLGTTTTSTSGWKRVNGGGAKQSPTAGGCRSATAHMHATWRNAGAVDEELAGANQSAPLLVSSTGRVVWSERPFAYAFDGDRIPVTGRDVVLGRAGSSLAEAYRAASSVFFPASGRAPSRELFTGPQYNTWIQMPYTPTADGVLAYTRQLLDEGLPGLYP